LCIDRDEKFFIGAEELTRTGRTPTVDQVIAAIEETTLQICIEFLAQARLELNE